MSCYVLYRHVLLFSLTHCRRHSVASVFHYENLFLHWSSSFMGVNCLSHPIFNSSRHPVNSDRNSLPKKFRRFLEICDSLLYSNSFSS